MILPNKSDRDEKIICGFIVYSVVTRNIKQEKRITRDFHLFFKPRIFQKSNKFLSDKYSYVAFKCLFVLFYVLFIKIQIKNF